MAQQPRRRLVGLELTGARRALRNGSLLLVTVLAAVSAMLHLVERHRAAEGGGWDSGEPYTWGPAHSLAGESAGMPILIPLLVVGLAFWARPGFPRALLPAALAVGNFLAIVIAWVAAHALESTDDPRFTVLAILSGLALGVAGVWLFVVELVVPFAERRRLEATDPVFPTARVV